MFCLPRIWFGYLEQYQPNETSSPRQSWAAQGRCLYRSCPAVDSWHVFVGTSSLRKNKVIFVISAAETNPLDKKVLRNVSLRAKCQGYAIFVFSFLWPYTQWQEWEELASHPLNRHLVQLGRIHKPDLSYITKFVKPFVHLIRCKSLNLFPSIAFTID